MLIQGRASADQLQERADPGNDELSVGKVGELVEVDESAFGM